MPVQKCQKNGKPGYRWGEQGKCYTYPPGNKSRRKWAYSMARRQGQAIKANSGKG